MFTLKEIIGVLAVFLTLLGYAPYIRDIFKNKTKPHVFSWLVWSILTGIIYALQLNAGAGAGSWVTLILVVIMIFIFFLSLKRGSMDIKKIDIVFLGLALLALPLWLIAEQPVLSIILLSTVDMLGFAPTVRKSWNAPYSETLSLYTITTFRHGLSLLALEHYSIVTWLFPGTWVVANAAFSIFLILRRRKISRGVG
jgi:hypothetical protein